MIKIISSYNIFLHSCWHICCRPYNIFWIRPLRSSSQRKFTFFPKTQELCSTINLGIWHIMCSRSFPYLSISTLTSFQFVLQNWDTHSCVYQQRLYSCPFPVLQKIRAIFFTRAILIYIRKSQISSVYLPFPPKKNFNVISFSASLQQLI